LVYAVNHVWLPSDEIAVDIDVCAFCTIWGCIRKFLDQVDNEINNNKHFLRSNTKGYGGKNSVDRLIK